MISGHTKLVCIIGHPIQGSLSPTMHNAAFASHNLDWAYVAFDVTPGGLGRAVEGARALGIAGLNVTMPHKTSVIDYLDIVSEEASGAGSVNTIVNNQGKLEGYSTDGEGFIRSLADNGEEVAGSSVFLLGAGGAGRAIAYALAGKGAARIALFDTDTSAAERTAGAISSSGAKTETEIIPGKSEAAPALADAGLVINATPLGKTHTDELTFLVDGLTAKHFVADLSTVPPLSALLVAAQKRGCKVMGGLEMLVHQGALSYKLWTGREAPLNVMRRSVGLAG